MSIISSHCFTLRTCEMIAAPGVYSNISEERWGLTDGMMTREGGRDVDVIEMRGSR